MIKNVYRKEETNRYFIREVEEHEYIDEDVFICNISDFAIVSKGDSGYEILGNSENVSLEASVLEITLNNEPVRIYRDNGKPIAEFYADQLFLYSGKEIRIVSGNCISNYDITENFIISV